MESPAQHRAEPAAKPDAIPAQPTPVAAGRTVRPLVLRTLTHLEAAQAILADALTAPVDAAPQLYAALRCLQAALMPQTPEDPSLALLVAAPPPGVLAQDTARWQAAVAGVVEAARLHPDPHATLPAPPRAQWRWLAGRVRVAARRLGRSLPPGQRTPVLRHPVQTASWAGLAVLVAVLAVLAALPDGVASNRGWHARIYPALEFKGDPVVRRDAELIFFWDEGPAAPTLPEDRWSARWDGCLQVDAAGKYAFNLGSDDGSRMFVDGTKVVENWGSHGMRYKGGEVVLEAGPHHLRVEYYDSIKAASLVLKMGVDGAAVEVLAPGLVTAPQDPDADHPCGEP